MDGRTWIAVLFAGTLISSATAGQPTKLQVSWRDDAALHDVEFVSPRDGWAVGDHGALFRTTDGGANWAECETGVAGSLRTICRLTDQVGWIAGAWHRGLEELSEPVLLATRDGGETWEALPAPGLSPLNSIRFADLDLGLAVGEPTSDNPAGVWQTSDGGKTWNAIPGPAVRGWNAVWLLGTDQGVLADRDGNVALLMNPRLLPSRLPALSGRAIRGVTLTGEQRGWLVGEGGLVMTSPSGGVVWETPRQPLPEEIRILADFRSVAAVGDAVWIAGKPGGAIWHSPDAGRNWIRQPTNITTPINKLHFVNAKDGCAVGELGVVLITHDGGETWKAARGGQRHAALLSIHARSNAYAPEVTAILGGEQGYRMATWIATRAAETRGLSAPQRIEAAVSQSGGSSAEIAWQLPLDVPGLELESRQLDAAWRRRTEGQLTEVLVGGLVREIRTWRPHVVVVDQPAPEDAAANFIYEAALLAVEQAGDGTRYVTQRELAGLQPWKVERVYLNLLPGSTGTISLDPFELLPRWGGNARKAAGPARDLLEFSSPYIVRPNFRLISNQLSDELSPRTHDLFSGLNLAPGGDVRRELPPFDSDQLELQTKISQRYRNVIAHAEQSFGNPLAANQMLAQLGEVTAGMNSEQAAQTLYDLWTEYRQRGQYDLAEAAADELVRSFPDSSASASAARWLISCLLSEEVAWHRVRELNQPQKADNFAEKKTGAQRIRQLSRTVQITRLPDWKQRAPRARKLVTGLEQNQPRILESPESQLTLAALRRASGSPGDADTVVRRNLTAAEDNPQNEWAGVFRREVWLPQPAAEVPDGISACLRAGGKPILDGILSDECWQDAREWRMPYRTPATMPDSSPLVMLTYDAEYLYLAASVPRIDGLPNTPPQLAGRTHDADLRRQDRLCIRLDLDRDYATWYEFQIDQRGWTADSCWNDAAWNPKWFAAIDSDDSNWRAEIAIPWSELTPQPPKAGAAWGLSLERVAPTVGRQSWMRPSLTQQDGSSFGIVRFE